MYEFSFLQKKIRKMKITNLIGFSEWIRARKKETGVKMNKWKNKLFVFGSLEFVLLSTQAKNYKLYFVTKCGGWRVLELCITSSFIWSIFIHISCIRWEWQRERKKKKNQNTKKMLKMRQTRVSLKMCVRLCPLLCVCVCLF